VVNAAELAGALEQARAAYRPPPSDPWIYSLRPSRPFKPPGTQLVHQGLPEPPEGVLARVEGQPVWHAKLDISVWRLPHLWRLVASFVVRRLRR
jgi:hypothetical protein